MTITKKPTRLLNAPIDKNFIFISDSQDVEATKEHIIIPDGLEIRSLFVKGSEVWGMESTIPYLWNVVYPLSFKPEYESEYAEMEEM
jgi:hypothetical protein